MVLRFHDLPANTQQELLVAESTPKKRKSRQSVAEDEFDFQLRAYKIGGYQRNFRFALGMGRKWHADFAFPRYMILVEIEGLVVRRIGGQMVSMGRHANVAGFREDCVKYASAALLGWTVLRFEQSMVKSGYAMDTTLRLLNMRSYAALQKGPTVQEMAGSRSRLPASIRQTPPLPDSLGPGV